MNFGIINVEILQYYDIIHVIVFYVENVYKIYHL